MDLSRVRHQPKWMKDYVEISEACLSEKTPTKKRSISAVTVETQKKMAELSLAPASKKVKPLRNRAQNSNKPLESRRHLTLARKKIRYVPLAFLPKKNEESWKRSTRLYKRLETKEASAAYIRSKLYKTAKKAKELIEKVGNDDFLTEKFSVVPFKGKGLGLKAVKPIEKDEVITFYGGEIVDTSLRNPDDFQDNHYLFGLPQEGFCIDGEVYGSHGSIVNHGKKPNAFAFLLEEDDMPTQVAYIASRAIKPGDPIEINYDEGRKSPLFFDATGEELK
jgi:hypothetical protein